MTKLTTFWKKIGRRTKILLIGGASCLVILIVILEIVLNSTSYELMYSGMNDADAGQVVTQLKSMGVKYKVQGDNIYVDKSKADETRMQLAENGYPQSTLNYSVYLSGTSWAMTDSDKNRMALYQTQNRLQDTIKTIPGVRSCVVTIGQSDDETYVLSSDKVPVTASVKLNLQSGLTLTSKQVNGIVQLVAHSVPNLSSDNVTLLDSDGNQLNDSANNTSGATADQLALQHQVENELQKKVLSVLTPVFGSGNVVAAAGATLDFSQRTTSSVTYTSPNSGTVGLPSSQSTNVTVSSAGGTGASGVPGVNNGQPDYATTTSSSVSGGTVTQTSSQASYLYNTVNQQIQSQGGALTGLTISVQINSRSQSAANVNVDDIKQSVAYAVGMTDTADISVQLLPFATANSSSGAAQAASGGLPAKTLLGAGAGALLLLAALLVALAILRARRRKRAALQLAAAEAAEQEAVLQAAAPVEELPQRTIEETIEESLSKNTVKNQIEDFADKKPELVAQLLRNWLKD